MARAKRPANAKKKRRTVLKQTSDCHGQRSRLYRKAREQVTRSFVYPYRNRKTHKGSFRHLWIQRIDATSRARGMAYNRFIQGLGPAGAETNCRMFAELAVSNTNTFNALVRITKDALPEDVNTPKA